MDFLMELRGTAQMLSTMALVAVASTFGVLIGAIAGAILFGG